MKKSTMEQTLKKAVKQANKILKSEGMFYEAGKLRNSVNGREKTVANCMLLPTQIIEGSGDGDKGYSIIMYAIVEDVIHGPIKIDSMEIERPNYLTKYFGGICNIYPDGGGYKQLLFALKLLLKQAEFLEEFSKIGIQYDKAGNRICAFGNSIIGANENAIISEDIQEYRIDRCNIDEKKAYKQFLKLLKVAKPHVAFPMVCHLLVGLLFRMFYDSGHPVNFGQFVVGPTGALKTTLTFLIQNIFNKSNPDMNLHASCFDTVNDIEAFLHSTSIGVGILDDLHPTADPVEARRLENKVQRIVRNIGDGHGKGRLKSDLTRQEKFAPRCAVTVTGEYGLIGQSTGARMYNVEMTRQDVSMELLTELQRDERILSTCVYNFLEWILPNYDGYVKAISDSFESRRNDIIDELGDNKYHLRKPKMAASYLTALELFLVYGSTIGAVSEKKYLKTMKRAKRIFVKGIIDQNDDFEDGDPVYMFLKTLENLRISNRIKVGEIGQQITDKSLVAFEDSTYLYLLPNAAYNAVFSFWQSRRQNFPLKERALSKALYTRGLLEVDNSGDTPSMHKKKKLNDDFRSRVLYIKKDVMSEVLSNSKS